MSLRSMTQEMVGFLVMQVQQKFMDLKDIQQLPLFTKQLQKAVENIILNEFDHNGEPSLGVNLAMQRYTTATSHRPGQP